MKTLIKSFMPFFAVLLLNCCRSCNNPQTMSIIYDNGTMLRVVALKTNDIVRLNSMQTAIGFDRITINSKDSINMFVNLVKQLEKTDTKTYTKDYDISADSLRFACRGDANDIPATTMIVFNHFDATRNDTLFINDATSSIRFNNWIAKPNALVAETIIRLIGKK